MTNEWLMNELYKILRRLEHFFLALAQRYTIVASMMTFTEYW